MQIQKYVESFNLKHDKIAGEDLSLTHHWEKNVLPPDKDILVS